MSKKSTTIHNHIENVNVELDYDKLARAMLKVQEEREKGDADSIEIHKKSFLKIVVSILKNENEPTGKMTPAVFSILVSWLFVSVAVLFWIISFVGVAGGVYWLFHTPWANLAHVMAKILFFALLVAMAFLMSLFGLMLYAAAHEIEEEKDRNYITAVFSGVVSVAALVVALAGFFRGVG